MDAEIAKAINRLSEKINNVQKRIDQYFENRCDQSAESISLTDGGIMDMAEIVSTHEEAIKELAGIISDMAEEKGEFEMAEFYAKKIL